jgi:hypothetical protein
MPNKSPQHVRPLSDPVSPTSLRNLAMHHKVCNFEQPKLAAFEHNEISTHPAGDSACGIRLAS